MPKDSPGLSDHNIEYRLYGYPTNTCDIPRVVDELRQEGVTDKQLQRCLTPRDQILLQPGGKEQWVRENLYPDKLNHLYGEAFAQYVMDTVSEFMKWGGHWEKVDHLAERLATHPVPPVQRPVVLQAPATAA